MLTRANLQNILIFLERVSVTGKEAFALTETYQAVQYALNPPAPPPIAQAAE
jgi:hypothetical protein